MTTLVGTQKTFSDALQSLLELDYDAIEAYKVAIERLEDKDFKAKLTEFKGDHERHVREISDLLRKHGSDVPDGPSLKQWLTKGKVVLADLMGDRAILSAMEGNEEDTNTAYDRMHKHPEKWPDATDILDRGFRDEKRHIEWLQNLPDDQPDAA